MKSTASRNFLLGALTLLTILACGWIVATVEARHSHAIGPTLAGRVARVLVDQGDSVKAGQHIRDGRTHEEAGEGRPI